MEHELYVMFIERGKTYNRITKEVVTRHVDNLRRLESEGHMELCGVFKGYPGVAGMVIIRAQNFEEADALAKREPLVIEGYATYKLRRFIAASSENNFLL